MSSDDPLARVEELVADLEAARRDAEFNRIALLGVLTGVLVGVLIWTGGATTAIESWFGAGARWRIGAFAIAAGVMLALGLLGRPRRARVETTGLVGLALWHGGMASSFVVSLFMHPPGVVSKSFPVAVYGGYLLLLGVHLWTLLRRSRRGHA